MAKYRRKNISSLLLIGTLLAGCATTTNPDPFEPMNRKIMTFNDSMDRWLLKPIARGYVWLLPEPVSRGVRNFFGNLAEPGIALNQFLQGKPILGGNDLARFLVNSTIGIGGVFEVAGSLGLRAHEEDFGQTLGVWGASPGAYIVVPFWGPAGPRDGLGDIFSRLTYPPAYLDSVRARNSLTGLWIINRRVSVLAVEKLISGDRYLFVRDAYLQRRDYLVNDGRIIDPFLDDEEE